MAGAIFLAQALLNAGDAAGAIAQLEDAVTGPLTLIRQKHSALSRPEFAVQAHETALRAYASANPPQSDKVTQTIALLENAMASMGGQSSEQITHVLLGISGQLQRQISELRAANRQADADRLATTFAQVLDRVAEKKEEIELVDPLGGPVLLQPRRY